jgi:membrane-bound ClpP family serine protease
MLPFFLLTIGCFLIFCEFYLAGLVVGTLGGVLVFASIILFAIQYESTIALMAYIIIVGIILFYLCKFALWKVRATKSKSSLYSENNQEGFIAATFDKSTIGKVGVVIADLKPGGYILIEGKKHAAISLSGYLPNGSVVRVIGGEGESLTVGAQ